MKLLQEYGAALVVAGRAYRARACGRGTDGGLWEGWLEFIPDDGSPVLRSARETIQPNETDLHYWAGGLTATYLEGSLDRTVEPPEPRFRVPAQRPVYGRPAPPPTNRAPRAVLDPFAIYTKDGEDLLRRELGALRDWHLRNIVRTYGLADERLAVLEALSEPDLVALIVAGVRGRAAPSRP